MTCAEIGEHVIGGCALVALGIQVAWWQPAAIVLGGFAISVAIHHARPIGHWK